MLIHLFSEIDYADVVSGVDFENSQDLAKLEPISTSSFTKIPLV